MTDIPKNIRDIREGAPTPAEALRGICRLKTEAVVKAWHEYGGRNMEGIATFQTRNGSAQIGAVVHSKDETGLDLVDVWTGPQQGPPAFRIVNPPMLVQDPLGEVVLTEPDPYRDRTLVRRYRVDPLQCIAEVISSRRGE